MKMSFLPSSLLFLFLVSSFLSTSASLTQLDLCNPDQRDALLDFKNEFGIMKPDSDISFYPKTESWVNNSDCCSWDGITCDAQSKKVIGLDLTASCLNGRLESNSSLFRLRYLRDLNLAYNDFIYSPIPSEFDKLKELERLNLSQSSLSGQIPNKLLQLTKLVSLDLSSYSILFSKNSLSIDKSFLPLLARNLSNLIEIDMSLVNISSIFPHDISNMSSLRSLGFEECNLTGEFPSSVLLMPNLESITLDYNLDLRGNLPDFLENNSLQLVSISDTSFSGTIPDSISNLKHLTSLKLSDCKFSGKIPYSLGNLSHLSTLYLPMNNFTGEIPSSISNLKQLVKFKVRDNKLSGNFPFGLLNLTQLLYINLESNSFTGFLPPNISQLSKLESFRVSDNSFIGDIPSSLFKIPSLTTLYLDDNNLTDLVGIENISLLPNLQLLRIGSNNYRVMSPLDLNVFSSLKHLNALDLSGIPLTTTNVTYDSKFSSHLEYLDLSRCNITEFPEFMRNQRNMSYLYLSNNKIKGQVPNWLWCLPKLLKVDLSNNFLNGFEASPKKICVLSSLSTLDLSNNNLHGSIPRCLEAQMISFSDLNLRNNSLNGSLPDIFTNAKMLRSLDVSHNQLVGKLPTSLRSCSSLQVLNVGNNHINDTLMSFMVCYIIPKLLLDFII